MKNGLISLFAIPFIIGLAGCASTPIVKEEKFLPKPKIEKKYVPPKNKEYNRTILAQSNPLNNCDCIGLIITLYDVHSDLITLTNIERDAIEGLKRKPNNPSDEIDLEVTQELKRRIMEYRDFLSQDIEDSKCLEYKPLETIL
ncbi:MAG: hypothetical protein KKF67_03565 [Nanoarchaeota archaeon]|nr:hypothetical protein [Nanoarchaeota archaeon]